MNWMTTYKDYRGSLLFRIADRLLASQSAGESDRVGDAWDYYFPFASRNISELSGDEALPSSFLAFLRFSYYRPRDITAMMTTIQDIVRRERGTVDYITAEDFDNPSFRDALAEYLLGEIRDQLLFYYSQDEYTLFLQFFLHLRGRKNFTYDEFVDAFNAFVSECADANKTIPQFCESAPTFLQFLFELNVICYKERESDHSKAFIRWCFRERTLSNMAPKVRVGTGYEVFYGLTKALNVGRPIQLLPSEQKKVVGTIIRISLVNGHGHIRGGADQTEFYFKTSDLSVEPQKVKVGDKVEFEIYVKYGKARAKRIHVLPRTPKRESDTTAAR